MRNLVGGKAAVGNLVEEFRVKYKRRPAMKEVLGGFLDVIEVSGFINDN